MSAAAPRDKALFYLATARAIQSVCDAANDVAYAGWRVIFSPPLKTRIQEERAHAMFGDIAKQFQINGRFADVETMKRLCIDQFRRDSMHDADLRRLWESMGQMELWPSLDGTGIVAVGWQSRHFPKKLYSAMIEWLFAFGANNGIVWSDESRSRGPTP